MDAQVKDRIGERIGQLRLPGGPDFCAPHDDAERRRGIVAVDQHRPAGCGDRQHAVARDGKILLRAGRRRAPEHANGVCPGRAAIAAARARGAMRARLSSPSVSSAFRPAALLFDFSPRMRGIARTGLIPRNQLAGLAAFQVAHRDGVAGLDVDEDRAIALHLVALHAGRQRDLSGPQDEARPWRAGSNGGVGRLAHLDPVVGETSLPAREIILAGRIGSKATLGKARELRSQASAR